MAEATGCWAIISHDSCVWTKVCCSYTFSSNCMSCFSWWTEGSQRMDWDVTGPLFVCSAVHSRHNGRMWCHTVLVWHLGCSCDHLPRRIYKELGLIQNQWREIKGSDGLFNPYLERFCEYSVECLFCEFSDVNFVEWKEVKWAHLASSMPH